MKSKYKKHIINDAIKAPEVRLIDNKGNQEGIKRIEEALQLAQEKELDLLLISPDAKPPVCKLIDYGQFRYEEQKKEKLARKSNKSGVIKELKMSPKISDNDLFIRVKRANKFLEKGYKVKVTIFFKGREIVHSNLGMDVLNRFLSEIEPLGLPDSAASQAKRLITVIVSPKPGVGKKK